MTPAFRELLRRTGPLLDPAMPFDLGVDPRDAAPPQHAELGDLNERSRTGYGLPASTSTPRARSAQVCVPVSAYPPAVVLGQALVAARTRTSARFLMHRALKIVQTNAAALSRTAPIDLWPLLAAYLKAIKPTRRRKASTRPSSPSLRRVSRALPGPADPQSALLAADVIGRSATGRRR